MILFLWWMSLLLRVVSIFQDVMRGMLLPAGENCVCGTLKGPDIAISTFNNKIFIVSKGTHPDVHTATL